MRIQVDRRRRGAFRVPAFVVAGLLFLLATGLLAPRTVRAELEVGADAVEVEAKDFINIEPLKLLDLSGRLILLELFTTT